MKTGRILKLASKNKKFRRKIISFLQEETKTYTITASENTHLLLQKVLIAMRVLGGIGASRLLTVYVDGDGSFQIKIKELEDLSLDGDVFYKATDKDTVSVESSVKLQPKELDA